MPPVGSVGASVLHSAASSTATQRGKEQEADQWADIAAYC